MKEKKLVLKKEVIADLSNKEMNKLEGGTGSDWFCGTTGGGDSCHYCTPTEPIPVPTPEPTNYWICEVSVQTDYPCW